MNASLEGAIEGYLAARGPDSVVALGEILRQRFGPHTQAILFYGSCRRSNDDTGGIVDLYVLVDDYRAAHGSFLPALANRVLAPNVYYLEAPVAGRTARRQVALDCALQRSVHRNFRNPTVPPTAMASGVPTVGENTSPSTKNGVPRATSSRCAL